MGKTHTKQHRLAEELVQAQSEVIIGARYWHYKHRDKVYEVIGLGFLEASDELCVIYHALYGEHLTFIRPDSVA